MERNNTSDRFPRILGITKETTSELKKSSIATPNTKTTEKITQRKWNFKICRNNRCYFIENIRKRHK